MAPSKKNLKEYYEDGNLDLSLLDLQEVPVREIAAIPKATNLDLSCNAITVLPKTFASSLTHLVKLDLSKNHLTALPDNFGLLVNLKHLDLDSNKVVSLPLSFGNLKALRWLDLKQNPLMPKLAEIAGQCLDAKQCQAAARNVVAALRDMQQQVDAEISRRKEQQQKKAEKEEMAKNQNKENQQPKKKKKKITNAGSQNTDPKHTNGHPHLDKEESLNSIKESAYEEKTAPKNKSAQKPGFFRKMGRFLSTVLKWVVMSILLFAFCSFLLSLFDEDLYAATKKKVNDIIQTSVPKQYLKQWNRGLATTRKAAERWSEQFIAISVDCYNKGYDYFVIMSNNEVIQQYLESIKSGWHILWIKVSETAVQIPSYLGSFQNFLYNESSNKTN